MALIKPFAALRPKPELASRICELPYDVMSSEEAGQMAAGNPLSFCMSASLRSICLLILTFTRQQYMPKAKENFRRLISEGALRQETKPCFYLYRQIMGAHSQMGLVAAASCEDYFKGRHQKARVHAPGQEDDRVRHMEALDSQTGPVFLSIAQTSQSTAWWHAKSVRHRTLILRRSIKVRHTAWVISEPAEITKIEKEFGQMPCLYIADVHHRSAPRAESISREKRGWSERVFSDGHFSA